MSNVITPINVALITQAVVDQLKADTRLEAAIVERSAPQNESPNSCPWIGVYRVAVQLPQRTLTSLAGFRQQRVQLLVLVQQANGTSGEACEDDLEALLMDVQSALLSDTTLGGVVQFLDEFEVNYTQYMRTTEGEFMQTAAIQFVALTNTTIT